MPNCSQLQMTVVWSFLCTFYSIAKDTYSFAWSFYVHFILCILLNCKWYMDICLIIFMCILFCVFSHFICILLFCVVCILLNCKWHSHLSDHFLWIFILCILLNCKQHIAICLIIFMCILFCGFYVFYSLAIKLQTT